jgi:dephospho-CoA kinase
VSKWAGKYVIGLTGNIATGKSVARRMLEHLGAYGIDADALGHRAIAHGAPGYQAVVETFGQWILDPGGQIDRAKLGRVVFSDAAALVKLEEIVHPLVGQAVDLLIKRSHQKVVVIEAIKLLESDLKNLCDSIWVTFAPYEAQLQRLVERRKMSETDARQRIAAQPPQEQKMAAANIVIKNDESYEETWQQIVLAWQQIMPQSDDQPTIEIKRTKADEVSLQVVRARPKDSKMIARFINHNQKDAPPLAATDIMAAFGENAFLMLQAGEKIVGLISLQVENLISRTADIVVDPSIAVEKALKPLIEEMERASMDLQSEASLVFAPKAISQQENLWKSLGYQACVPEDLDIQAWQEAAKESVLPGTTLFFKQLRQDRVLRPI